MRLPAKGLTGVLVVPRLDVLVRVLDHDHGRIHHGAHRDRNAAQRHDVGVHALVVHDGEGGQDSQGKRDDGDKGGAEMKQEQHADERNDDELLDQLFFEVFHRAFDQVRPVVDRNDLDPWRQARLEFLKFCFYSVDGLQRVLARAHHDDAAGNFALTVELGNAAPHFRADLDARHVTEPHRNTGIGRRQRNFSEVVERLQISGSPHHVFGFTQF